MVLPLLRGRLSALARRYRVPGAQLAIRQAGETWTVEVGELEHHSGRRVTRESAFPVGSITKAFTATTAMVLVADGDLDLDAPVGALLPELADLPVEVTLRQLLSHTAGFAAGPEPEEVAAASSRRYLIDHCRLDYLVASPGAAFSYSNLGYVLVGRLIETATGMSWRDATESILLRPLGIAPAFVTEYADAGRPVAVGHSVNLDTGRTRPVQQSLPVAEAPAGALAVSAADLLALSSVHLDPGVPDLLPPDYAEQMRRQVPDADPCGLADGWGLGLAVFSDGVTKWLGHDGNGHGTSCYLRLAPEMGCAVALTSNSNSGTGLWADLLAELAHAGLPFAAAPQVRQAEPAVPAPPDCAGRYVNGDVEYAVAVRHGQPYLAVDGGAFARLTCHDGLTFTTADPVSGRQVLGGRFVRDPGTGDVNAILVGGRLARRNADSARQTEIPLIA